MSKRFFNIKLSMLIEKRSARENILNVDIYKLSANEMNNCRGDFCLRDDKTQVNFVVPIVVILHVIAVTPNVRV